MENIDIRLMAKEASVPFWQIAELMGISENTMTRLMRKPLNCETKQMIIQIINKVKEDRKHESI